MKKNIIGVSIGWSLNPQLYFSDGTILYSSACDRILYPEYFPDNNYWPINPNTGQKLEVVRS